VLDVRDVHCLLIMAKGQDIPENGRFVVEATFRVWHVPSYRIGSTLIPGWTMWRLENAKCDPASR
jgi:hypothetical protein